MDKKLYQSVVREMIAGDLNRVLLWRNHDDVRRFMYSQHEITEEEHLSWFEETIKDENRHPLLFEVNNSPVGFINFSRHGSSPIADWGFYLAPDAPKGTGRQLALCALNYAFHKLKLHKVCGEVLALNESSIQFHFKSGFKQEGVLREQHFDGADFHDVVCFGLLAHEWSKKAR